MAQLRGCVRHLVVFAGYGPCLAATLALHKAKLLPEDAPGKVGSGRWEDLRGVQPASCARRASVWHLDVQETRTLVGVDDSSESVPGRA